MRVLRFAIREEGYFSILQGPEMGWRGWTPWLTPTKRKLSLGKIYVFVVEKYVEDVKQDQKNVPDLVESIRRLARLAKEELQRILMKMSQIRSEI